MYPLLMEVVIKEALKHFYSVFVEFVQLLLWLPKQYFWVI